MVTRKLWTNRLSFFLLSNYNFSKTLPVTYLENFQVTKVPSDRSSDFTVSWLQLHFLTNCTNCTNCTAMYGSHQGSSCRLMLKKFTLFRQIHLNCTVHSAHRTVYNGSNAPIWLKNMSKFSQCTRKKGTTGPPYLCLQQKCTAVSGRNVNKTYAYQHCFMFILLPETFSSFSSLLL